MKILRIQFYFVSKASLFIPSEWVDPICEIDKTFIWLHLVIKAMRGVQSCTVIMADFADPEDGVCSDGKRDCTL